MCAKRLKVRSNICLCKQRLSDELVVLYRYSLATVLFHSHKENKGQSECFFQSFHIFFFFTVAHMASIPGLSVVEESVAIPEISFIFPPRLF